MRFVTDASEHPHPGPLPQGEGVEADDDEIHGLLDSLLLEERKKL
jgi:hypothetical protein